MPDMKWNLKTVALLFMKNLTGSGKWAKRYYLAQGYDIRIAADPDGKVRVFIGRMDSICAMEAGVSAETHAGAGEGK